MRELEQRIESREVAEMVEKDHKNLLRDIRTYCNHLAASKIEPGDFFVKSTYTDGNNQIRPCYITKKGCEFIAHKLTGTKGTAFTAKYINRFHEMESKLLSQAPAALSENDMEILAEKVAERLIDRSRKTTEAENRYIYPEHGSSILSIGFCRGGR